MAIHWIRGFRRLGWVLVVLASPAVFLVAREYSKTRKYDAAALQSLYPDLPFTPEATARALDVENEISSGREVAQANRNWYSENRWKLENLRTAGEYPQLWEGLSERTDWLACCAYFAMGLAGLTVITQGGISLANWIIAGFRSPSGQLEAAKPKSSDPGTVQVVASIPNLGGSTLALLVGGLLILAGVTKASSKNTALEAGLVIVFGATTDQQSAACFRPLPQQLAT